MAKPTRPKSTTTRAAAKPKAATKPRAAAKPKAAAKPAAKPAPKPAPKAARSSAGPADAMRNAASKARAAGDRARAAGGAMADGASKVGLTMIGHAEANVAAAFAAMRAATSAKSPQEVVKIQADYLKQAGARAMEQAKEVGESIASVGREAMKSLKG